MYFNRLSRVLLSLFAISAIGFSGCNQPSEPQLSGKISATITGDGNANDDTTIPWKVDGRRSQWQGQLPNGSIILLGLLPFDDINNTTGSVAIRFDYDASTEKQHDAKIRYYADGLERPCFSSKGGTASVMLDSAEFKDGKAHLKGTFKAVMPFRLKGKSIEDNTREFADGSFDVVVPIVDDPQASAIAN